jgi:voltage-dependent calcium channel L type alpha-1D
VNNTEIVFLAIFTVECFIKIVGLGFLLEKRTYCRDPWNLLDLLVVIFGWLGFVPGFANVSALRSLRILRPLRSINAVKEMKIFIQSLLQALPGLGNTVLFIMFMLLVFAIIGVNSFRGVFY